MREKKRYKIQDTCLAGRQAGCRKKNLHASRIMHHASGRRAVSAVEYAVLIVVLILALLAMQFYLRRAMCGRLRSAGDVFGQGRQYEPGVTLVQ
jgi:hypothetical protein